MLLSCVPIPAPRVTDKFVIVGLSQEKLWLPCFSLSMYLVHEVVTVYLHGFLVSQGLDSTCILFPPQCLPPTQFLRMAYLPWGGFEAM